MASAGAARIYSERFLQVSGHEGAGIYWVPDGKRVVLRNLVLSTVEEFAGANLGVGSQWAVVFNFQAGVPVVALDMRIVAYAEESIQLMTFGVSTWATLAGYQFDDPTGAIGPGGRTEYGSRERLSPLPA